MSRFKVTGGVNEVGSNNPKHQAEFSQFGHSGGELHTRHSNVDVKSNLTREVTSRDLMDATQRRLDDLLLPENVIKQRTKFYEDK